MALPVAQRSGGDAVEPLRAAEAEAEARDDLVEDERDVEVGGDLADAPEEARPRLEGSLERLDDDACELVAMLGDDRGGFVEVVEGGDEHLVVEGTRDAVRVRDCAWVPVEPHRPLIAHHRVVVHAVVRALELQDLVALSVDAGQAHREEGRLAAAAVKAHHFGAGDVLDDLLAELDRLLVDDQVRGAALRDGAERFEHRRMRVPQNMRSRAE